MSTRKNVEQDVSRSGRIVVRTFGFAVVLAALAASHAFAQDILQQGGQSPSSQPQVSANANPTKFIVQFTKSTPRSARAQAVQQAGATALQDLSVIDSLSVSVPNQNVLRALMNNPNVKRVVPDRPLHEAMPPKSQPPKPTNLVATGVSSSEIDLTWNQGSGSSEDGFRIERCPGSGCGNFTTRGTVGANVFSFPDTGLGPGETYTYRVIAFLNGGPPSNRNSDPSDPAEATTDAGGGPPTAPSNLSATAVSDSQINLAWQDNSTDESNFEIDRCQGSGCNTFALHQTVGSGVTNFNDTGLPSSTTFRYRVRATNAAGNSGYTSIAEDTTDAPPVTPPAAPSALSAAAISPTQIDLTWMDNSADEDEFFIERCEGSGCSSFVQIDTVGANTQTYSDTGLTELTTYRYRVQASNTSGPSGFSNEDEATTLDNNPPPPLSYGGTRQIIPVTVQRVGPPDAYSDGTGVGVAVLDSGCDFNHRDLACTGMIDYFGGTGQDDRGHGTHVIGLINAQNNNFDIVGVAPEAKLYSYKTLGADGNGDESNFAAAINDIVDNPGQFPVPVGVINISAGRPLEAGELMEDTPMCQAAAAARAAGIVVVVSAGNDPSVEINTLTPAGCSAVIPVASTVATDGISTCPVTDPTTVLADSASNYTTDGSGVISAPGEERNDLLTNGFSCTGYLYGTLSTTWGGAQGLNPNDPNDPAGATRKIPIPLAYGGAQEARGTSFSAPLVTGIVARMKQVGIGGGTGDAAEVDAIRNEVFDTADRASANPNDPDAAPLRHVWADLNPPLVNQTDDGVKEGIAQAPKAP